MKGFTSVSLRLRACVAFGAAVQRRSPADAVRTAARRWAAADLQGIGGQWAQDADMRLLRGGHLRVRAPRGNSGPILANPILSPDTNCDPDPPTLDYACYVLCMPNNCTICVWVLWVWCFSECRSQNKVLLRSFTMGKLTSLNKKGTPFLFQTLKNV